METTMRRPALTRERIEEIKQVIAENPDMTRTQISRRICELWGWQSPTNVLKDISARDMLRELDKAGTITLPPSLKPSRAKGLRKPPVHIAHDTSPIECTLAELSPLSVEIVEKGASLVEFKSLIDQYHYLRYGLKVGESMGYTVRSSAGAPLACLLFGSAAWSCADRDRHIGWDKARRAEALHLMTNNVRFAVLPWVHVSCLASKALSLVARRISSDWQAKYGHPLLALETFVDVEGRGFTGACYNAAGWRRVGMTTGRGRDGGHHGAILPRKDIYMYPLARRHLEKLRGDVPFRWTPTHMQ